MVVNIEPIERTFNLFLEYVHIVLSASYLRTRASVTQAICVKFGTAQN